MRVLLVALSLLLVSCARPPSVDVAGERLVGKRDGNSIAFLGVPYAEPPLGDLRWRAPQPLASTQPERDATRFAPACMQTMRILDWYRDVAETFGGSRNYYPDLEISEDCLYLNIWTPDLDTDAAAPVMVWLHGGSNISGWSYEPNYHGRPLAEEGVVLVSIGYRVGLFGFMSHPDLDPAEPVANFGLWDAIAALQWVQANIERFGGDPGRVTLFGESAGAHNIVTLMLTEPARDLFHAAVAQSTTAVDLADAPLEAARSRGTRLAEVMGFDGDDALTKLRAAPAAELLTRFVESVSAGYESPVVDGQLLERHPWDIVQSEDFSTVPLIIGTNADEWWDYVDADVTRDDVVRTAMGLNNVDRVTALWAVGGETSHRRAIDRLTTADEFLCTSQALAARIVETGGDAWMYFFTRVREDDGGAALRAYHGAEYPYVFNTHDSYMATTGTDRELTRVIQAYWMNFAANHNPNGDELPDWPTFAASDLPVQELGDVVRTIPAPEQALCERFDPRGRGPG